MKRIITYIPTLVFILLLGFSNQARADDTDWSGSWSGALNTPGGSLPLILVIDQSPEGALSAHMESPAQAPGQHIPIAEITVIDGHMNFSIPALGASYVGQWDGSEEHFSGQFTQGMTFDLVWARSSETEAAAALPVRPQYPTEPFGYVSEDIIFDNSQADGVTLAGTLTLPQGEGPFPAAILISGSGPQDRNEEVFGHKPFLVLADWLTRQNIAVLRYDDRGYGQSTGSHPGSTSADFATDTNAAVSYLLSRPEVDASSIGVVGHSEGGLIGPLAALDNSDISYIILLAGPGIETPSLMEMQRRRAAFASGQTEEDLRQSQPIQDAVVNLASSDLSNDEIAAEMRILLDEETMTSMGLGAAERDALIARTQDAWFRYFVRYDPAPVFAEIDLPILAINGSLDFQVEADPNLDGLRTILADHDDATIIKLEGLNHMFQHAETGSMREYALIEETFAPHAMELISDWINDRFGED